MAIEFDAPGGAPRGYSFGMNPNRLFCSSLLSIAAFAADALAADAPALVAKVQAEISAERIKADIEKLASFGTRHTASEARNPIKGIGAASNWLGQQLQSVNTLPGGGGGPALGPKAAGMVKVFPEVWTEPAGELLPDETQLVNHIGFIRGKRPESENYFYYVVAHYDSLAADPLDWAADAPGANDNASGVAAVLEIARALADEQLDATVVFLLTSGGEQGSLGAKYHVENVMKLGYRVMGVINLDTIGGPPLADAGATGGDRPARVMAPDARGMELARLVRAAAGGTRVSPQVELAAEGPGLAGDERIFSAQKFPAVMFTQSPSASARRGAEDRAEALDPEYAADIARLAAGVIVHLANAPAPPGNVRFTAGADGAAKIEWDKNAEGDVAGYEVVQRAKDSDEWTVARDAGVELSAQVSAGDANRIFGVRAYDKSGYRGSVSVAVPEPAKTP